MKAIKLLPLLGLLVCFTFCFDTAEAKKPKKPKKAAEQEQVDESTEAEAEVTEGNAEESDAEVTEQKDVKKKDAKKKKATKKKPAKKKGSKTPLPRPQPKTGAKPKAEPKPAPAPAPVVEEEKATAMQTMSTDESMPQFPGGEEAMYAFIAENMQYPDAAQKANLSGRVVVRFFVDRKGALSNIKIEQSLSPECDAEALRIVKLMPAWNPAKQNGLPVAVAASIPVVFTLK